MKKNKKWLIPSVIFLLLGTTIFFNYIYKSHKTTEELNAEFNGEASLFFTSLKQDIKPWLNKTVILTGNVSSIDTEGVIIDKSIYCQFRKDVNFKLLTINQPITIKGVVIGYDDLLEELKVNQCIIKKTTND
ncbi:hypothetical protein [Tenacibaculum singaporense]|uniref:hypothetical protein n=1 Tax=Tenacibaculum singaporense TaxID=2358479 RepID=UPI000F62BC23|nr:hypothetical protein [Tenacibaculum singaporense]